MDDFCEIKHPYIYTYSIGCLYCNRAHLEENINVCMKSGPAFFLSQMVQNTIELLTVFI